MGLGDWRKKVCLGLMLDLASFNEMENPKEDLFVR